MNCFTNPAGSNVTLGDLLLAMVLYGHFRTEHLLVHHPHVGTPRDTVTARYNEGFLRVLSAGPAAGAGVGLAGRKGDAGAARRGPWHPSQPDLQISGAATGLSGAGLRASAAGSGVGLFALQAFVAVWQLELTNYVEHYGLTRKYLGDGKYEPVRPHHSWDSAHRVSGLLADQPATPCRPPPAPDAAVSAVADLSIAAEVPQLPTGYPPMTAMAMIPPLWRRRFNPRVRALAAAVLPRDHGLDALQDDGLPAADRRGLNRRQAPGADRGRVGGQSLGQPAAKVVEIRPAGLADTDQNRDAAVQRLADDGAKARAPPPLRGRTCSG